MELTEETARELVAEIRAWREQFRRYANGKRAQSADFASGHDETRYTSYAEIKPIPSEGIAAVI